MGDGCQYVSDIVPGRRLQIANGIQIVCGDSLLTGSATEARIEFALLHNAMLNDEEVTIVVTDTAITWIPNGGFDFKGKSVEKITRASSESSEYVISFEDGSHKRQPPTPQLERLFFSLLSAKRRQLANH